MCGLQQFSEVSTLIKPPLQIRQLRFREATLQNISEGVTSGFLTSAYVVRLPAFLLWVKTPSPPFPQDSIIPAPTAPVGAMLYNVQGILTIPQPICPPHNSPLGQIELRDQRPREAKPQHRAVVPKQSIEPRTIHLGSSIQLGNGKPFGGLVMAQWRHLEPDGLCSNSSSLTSCMCEFRQITLPQLATRVANVKEANFQPNEIHGSGRQ